MGDFDMRETEILNAVIDGTMLGIEDHGLMTAYVYLKGDGWGVGFGGYVLDAWDGKKRTQTPLTGMFVSRVLEVVGADKWEDLKGKPVRVESEGLGGGCVRIGHYVKDLWFNPKEEFKSWKQSH